MLVAYRGPTGLFALEVLCRNLLAGATARPRGQLGRLVQMAAKIRRLARNSKLGEDARHYIVGQFSTAASASDCETRSRRWSSATKGNETEMSHALGVQAESTGEWGGAAVSFATKEEAIGYIVRLAPRETSIFDIPVVESGDFGRFA